MRLTQAILAILGSTLILGFQENTTKVKLVKPTIGGAVLTKELEERNDHSLLSLERTSAAWTDHSLFSLERTSVTTSSGSATASSANIHVNSTLSTNVMDTTGAMNLTEDDKNDKDKDESLDDSEDGDKTGATENKEETDDLWTVNTVVGCNIVLAILALLLNGITMFHYRTQTTNLPSVLYFRNSLCDSFSAVGFLLQVPSVISVLKENTSVLLPLFSYWICTVAVRMSVFMNCVLGVVRCIKIVSPFYLVNRKMVTLSSFVYLLIWIAIASLDIWIYTTEITLENKVYLIKSLVLKTEPGFSIASLAGANGVKLSTFSQGEIVLVQFLSPVAVPALLCLFLMVIQVLYLKKKRNIEQKQIPEGNANTTANTKEAKRRNQKDRAAITILMVTTIYVVTTILSVAVWLVVYKDDLDNWRGDRIKKLSWRELGAIYFSSSTLPLVCSTLTPLTLLIRGKILYPILQEASRTMGWSGSKQ